MVQKRPLNAEEEYRQIKKAYSNTKLAQIYCKDVEMTEINCTSKVKAKLQNEFRNVKEQNAKTKEKELNLAIIRKFMNNYLNRGPIKENYYSFEKQHEDNDGKWSIWIRNAFSIVVHELEFFESLRNVAYTTETTQLKQWFAKTFITYCIDFHKLSDSMSKAEFSEYCCENPYKQLISKFMFEENPYKTILTYKKHLYLPNKEDKFRWIDRLSLAYTWVDINSIVRWKESLLYIVSTNLDDSDKNPDRRTAIPYSELCDMNLTNLEESYIPEKIKLNWDAIDALLNDSKLFACKSENSMYITSSKWYNLEISIHNLLANNTVDIDERTVASVVKEVIKNKRFKKNEQPTEEQLQSIKNSVRFRYSITSADAGTGKTAYHLKLTHDALKKLGYSIVVCVPTHAAKKPIIRDMKATKRGVHTLKLLINCKSHWSNKGSTRIMTFLQQNPKVAIFLDEMGMVDSESFGQLCKQILQVQATKGYEGQITKLILIGDHKQCPPVGNGCPFEDVYFANCEVGPQNQNVPVTTFTKQFRAKHADLTKFASYYAPNAMSNGFVIDDVFTKEYTLVNFDYTFQDVSDLKLNDIFEKKTKELYSHLKDEGVSDEDIFSMSPTNPLCFEVAEIIRSVYRPTDHERRQKYEKNNGDGKAPRYFAKNDKVFLDDNSAYYKRGDDSIVLDVNHYGPLLKLQLDYKDHKLVQKVLRLRDEDSPYQYKYADIPYEIEFIKERWHPDFKNESLNELRKPTLGFKTIDEELYENNCLEDDNFEEDKDDRIRAIRKVYEYNIRVDPFHVKPKTCMTTYKAQGRQNPICICIQKLQPAKQNMTSRQMYTQVTRTKERLYCLGKRSNFCDDYILKKVSRRCTFLSCMYNDTVPETQNCMIKRYAQNRIPYFIREKVWNKYAGYGNSKAQCYVCTKQVDIRNWHCAHIIAAADGGSLSVDNLRIACEWCNCSAGKQNFDEFKLDYQRKQQNIDRNGELERAIALIRENQFCGCKKIEIRVCAVLGEQTGKMAIQHLLRSGKLKKEKKPLHGDKQGKFFDSYTLSCDSFLDEKS